MKKTFIILLVLTSMLVRAQSSQSFDLSLRDEATGEWLIVLFEDFAVYECDFWDYKDVKVKDGRIDLTLVRDGSQMSISVGKEKGGVRLVSIDGGKKKRCTEITTKHLPDYPKKDTTAFKDNNYRRGDSVTLVGWLKNYPKEEIDRNPDFIVVVADIMSNDEQQISTKLDARGRFRLKIPVTNTQQVLIDWKRKPEMTVVEPGETYFYMHDMASGDRLMMGRNARVQNELMAHQIDQEFDQPEQGGMTAAEVIAYKNHWAAMLQRNLAKLDSTLAAVPTLSDKYAEYNSLWMRCSMGEQVLQTQFYAKDRVLPREVIDYVTRESWGMMRSPYTLCRDFGWLTYYYLRQANLSNTALQDQEVSPQTMRKMERNGMLTFSEEESRLIDTWQQMIADYAGVNPSDYQELDEKYRGVTDHLTALLKRDDIAKVISETLDPIKVEMQTIDSVCQEPILRDLCRVRRLCQQLEQTRVPLTESQMEMANGIANESLRNLVLERNDRYLTLKNVGFAYPASLRPSSDVEGMTDGEQMLRQITDPYRGRLIYIDVWGTWCSPCKQALKESHLLKEALRDTDIIYLYLCNRSSDESWRNVIKEYSLTGENSVHYNLPEEQQAAIEQYLNVFSYPTYKLIDRQGNIHDIDWRHTDDLNGFREEVRKYDTE